MRLLLLGFSRFAQRRVLPAAARLPAISGVDLATRRAADVAAAWRATGGADLFANYAEALARSDAEWVYVSGTNRDHAPWVEAALESGRHVIVDKPATTTMADAEHLLELADARRCCLIEALLYPEHPLLHAARDAVREAGARARHLIASFSFSVLPPGDFRRQPALGGGALLDLGIYAVSPGRLWFGTLPERAHCRVTARDPETGVETAFSLMLEFPEGRTLTGHFGFDTVYSNHLTVLCETLSVHIERAFTQPPDAALSLQLWDGRARTTLATEPADSCARFLSRALEPVTAQSRAAWAEALWRDACAADRLRRAAAEATA